MDQESLIGFQKDHPCLERILPVGGRDTFRQINGKFSTSSLTSSLSASHLPRDALSPGDPALCPVFAFQLALGENSGHPSCLIVERLSLELGQDPEHMGHSQVEIKTCDLVLFSLGCCTKYLRLGGL